MLQWVGKTLALSFNQDCLAQLAVELGENSAVISGSQGFLILVAGIVLAFAFQLLLANFFIALGISYSETESSDDRTDSLDETIDKIGTVVGLRTLGTFSITLFGACYLAVKLSFLHDAMLGAILGLVIWATYFSLLIWTSFTTVGSVIGTVVNSATSGLQGIIGTAAVALGAKQVSDRVVSTAEAAAATVRRELSSAVDYNSSCEAIANYLKQLRIPLEDRQELQQEFEKLITEPEMQSIARENHIQNIGRQTFVDLVSNRTDFSKNDVSQAMEQFDAFWQRLWGQQPEKTTENGDVMTHILPAQAENTSVQLSNELEQLIEQTRQQQAQEQAEATQKVAETAAWWLFGSAFTSAAASAIAGAISLKS